MSGSVAGDFMKCLCFSQLQKAKLIYLLLYQYQYEYLYLNLYQAIYLPLYRYVFAGFMPTKLVHKISNLFACKKNFQA